MQRDQTAGVVAPSAHQRSPHVEPIKPFVDHSVVRDVFLIKVEDIPHFGHVLQLILRFTEAVVFLKTKTVKNDVDPAGEPAGGELARVLAQNLLVQALTLLNEVKEVYFHYNQLPRLRPY